LPLAQKYQNEEHVLSGASLDQEELRRRERNLFEAFIWNDSRYNPNLSEEEN